MATDQASTEFGAVSRLRGIVFESLSLAASVVGILALGVLLVYVSIDAFDLQHASPEWVFTYVGTLVLPVVGFCLYSAEDREVARLSGLALVGGMVTTALLFGGIERLVGPIPRLSWHVAYLFAVVVPVVAYVGFVASGYPVGRVGFGLVGRILGGAGVGLALVMLFLVLDHRLWFLAHTLGVLPAVATVAIARRYPASPASVLAVPVGVAGIGVAAVLRDAIGWYPTATAVYAWTFALPVAGVVASLVALRDDRGTATAAGSAVFGLSILAAIAADTIGVSPGSALLVAVTVSGPIVVFLHRVFDEGAGREGLLFPVLVIGGILAGRFVVQTIGAPAPDPWLDVAYVTSPPSRHAGEAGLYPAIVGSVLVISLVAVLSFVLGVGSAVFLEEYAGDRGATGWIKRFVQINVANLAAVPSVVFGLLGLGLFANMLGLGFGTVVTVGVTLSLLILPITIISAQEAVRAVPDDLRQGSYAMGATRWQTTKRVVLPEAMPGIMTGTILALGRAIGETAPLIMVGAAHTVFSPPGNIWNKVSAMPMQIFAWSDFPQAEFRYGVVAAGVVTLLIVLLGLNATAIVIRNRSQ